MNYPMFKKAMNNNIGSEYFTWNPYSKFSFISRRLRIFRYWQYKEVSVKNYVKWMKTVPEYKLLQGEK